MTNSSDRMKNRKDLWKETKEELIFVVVVAVVLGGIVYGLYRLTFR